MRIRARARRFSGASFALLAVLALWCCAPASAETKTYVWQPVGNGLAWSEGGNWAGGKAPPAFTDGVELEFPLAACETEKRCPSLSDDIFGLRVGRITLQSGAVDAGGGVFDGLGYTLAGSERLELSEGITLTEPAPGHGSAPTVVSMPIKLLAANVWSVQSSSRLTIGGLLGGALKPLEVDLHAGAAIEFGAPVEAGSLLVKGEAGAALYTGAGGDLNGQDGEPVTLEGVAAHLGGLLGPLTLKGSTLEVGNSPSHKGPVTVGGDAHLEAGSEVHLEEPAQEALLPYVLKVEGSLVAHGARLHLPGECLPPGTTVKLIEAGKIEGELLDEAGAAIADGLVVPDPAGSACGASAGIQFGLTPRKLTATVLVPPAPPPGGGPGPAPSPGGVSSAAEQAALGRDLGLLARAPKFRRLPAAGGISARAVVLEPGVLSVLWRVRHGRHTILIASARHVFNAAGGASVSLRLTPAGRRILRRAHTLRISASASLTTAAGRTLHAQRSFSLSR